MARLSIFLLLPLSLLAFVGADEYECVYTVYVRTGSIIKGGTDSSIGLTLADASGRQLLVSDLVSWGGLMGADHDYYERGALDVFSGRGPCGLAAPICSLNLTSDGAGSHHGWYCDYVEVTATGPHLPCSQTLFYVRQWLATDTAPYHLYASVDGCADYRKDDASVDGCADYRKDDASVDGCADYRKDDAAADTDRRRRLVVGKAPVSESSSSSSFAM